MISIRSNESDADIRRVYFRLELLDGSKATGEDGEQPQISFNGGGFVDSGNTLVHLTGDAYYQNISGSSVDGDSYPGSPNPESVDMPISDEQIAIWKAQALAGGEITGDFDYEDDENSLGPKKMISESLYPKISSARSKTFLEDSKLS